ncbi:MAG: hypothetical protein QHH01_00330 [Spirochaetales bacterium]|nr:hypothetical protein [Spirochaetales bacterium]
MQSALQSASTVRQRTGNSLMKCKTWLLILLMALGVPAIPMAQAALWVDLAPLVELTDRMAVPAEHIPDAEELAWYFSRPALLTAGFALRTGPLLARMTIEMQQDTGEALMGGSLTNLLMSHDFSRFIFSNNYPRLGYLEGRGNRWWLSLGRRPLAIGIGTLSLSLSDENPWYDHAGGGLRAPLGAAILAYDVLAVSVPRRGSGTDVQGKNFFMHRLALQGDRLSFAFSEYNLVTGVVLDFQDIGPFVVYHHLFADGSNVMAQAECTVDMGDGVRIRAGVLMDDFRLASEGASSNPTAMGATFGIDLGWGDRQAGDQNRIAKDNLASGFMLGGAQQHVFERNGALRIGSTDRKVSFQHQLGVDLAWASTYLYRRSTGNPSQAFQGRYSLQTDSMGWPMVEPWLAWPLGPDRIMARLQYTGHSGRLAWGLRADATLYGAEASERTYQEPYAEVWWGPQAPCTLGWNILARVQALVAPRQLATLTASAKRSQEGRNVFAFSLSWLMRLQTGTSSSILQ